MAEHRNNLIDAFRGISILAVLVFHYAVEGFQWGPRAIYQQGALGVEIFFAISGVVITMTALRARGAADFAFRRFARIYPTFLVAATLTFLVTLVWDPAGQERPLVDYLLSLTLLAERMGHKFVDGAYWSLLIEVQFYALVALSLIILKKRFWMGVLAALVLGGLIRPLSKTIAAVLFSSYSAFFLIGMAAWYYAAERNKSAAVALAAGAIFTYVVGPQALIQISAVPITLIFLGLFVGGVNRSFGLLAWVGRISYPLYLLHQVLGLEVIAALKSRGVPDLVAFLLTTTLLIIVAAFFHYRLEERTQSLAMSWWRRRRTVGFLGSSKQSA